MYKVIVKEEKGYTRYFETNYFEYSANPDPQKCYPNGYIVLDSNGKEIMYALNKNDVLIVDGKVIKGNDDLEDMIKVLKKVSDICYNQETCNDKCPFYIKPGADYCRLDYAVPADWDLKFYE